MRHGRRLRFRRASGRPPRSIPRTVSRVSRPPASARPVRRPSRDDGRRSSRGRQGRPIRRLGSRQRWLRAARKRWSRSLLRCGTTTLTRAATVYHEAAFGTAPSSGTMAAPDPTGDLGARGAAPEAEGGAGNGGRRDVMSSVPAHARVVIIGAGIVGNSMAFHLAHLGWRDIVLVEKGMLPNPGGPTAHARNF